MANKPKNPGNSADDLVTNPTFGEKKVTLSFAHMDIPLGTTQIFCRLSRQTLKMMWTWDTMSSKCWLNNQFATIVVEKNLPGIGTNMKNV